MTATTHEDWNWDRDPLEHEYSMAARIHRADVFDPVARRGDALLLRAAMDCVRYWRFCPKPGCRRAKRCVDPKVECAWRKLPYLQRTFIPYVLKLKAEILAKRDAHQTPTMPPKPH